jgi:hypothetical protein
LGKVRDIVSVPSTTRKETTWAPGKYVWIPDTLMKKPHPDGHSGTQKSEAGRLQLRPIEQVPG